MWSLGFALLLLGACKYDPPRGQGAPGDGRPTDSPGETDSGADGPGDAMVVFDAPTDPSAGCFGTFVRVCLPVISNTGRTITNLDVDTDRAADCDPVAVGTNINACVIAADSIIIDGTLRATGSRPLVLLATRFDGQIIVNGGGLIDVASHRVGNAVTRGAGANPTSCAINAPTGAGGGGGGAFGGNGGNGGNGVGGGGGSGQSANQATTLRGGCPGSAGGNGAERGNGGGAVDLIAVNILINGKINASGSGGGGGSGAGVVPQGGGGGGSGGLIVFDSTNTTFNSCTFMAQGGGGGQGSLAVTSGEPGDDPSLLAVGTAASGGNLVGVGGTGGAGGVNGNGGNGGNSGGGGGGGGGGSTGRIQNFSATLQGSPTQTAPGVADL